MEMLNNKKKKIKKVVKALGKKWVSKTPTSFERKNFLDKESEKYLIDCIGNLIKGSGITLNFN